jgi:hypothetical protein
MSREHHLFSSDTCVVSWRRFSLKVVSRECHLFLSGFGVISVWRVFLKASFHCFLPMMRVPNVVSLLKASSLL